MNRNRPRAKPPRRITEEEFRAALDFAAGEKATLPIERGVIVGLIRGGYLIETPVGVGGFGRKLELTPRGTVERLARMKV
jgi:hypothetical protein